MPEISLKCRNCPRLKANKTNDLANDHTVPGSKTDVIQMLARSVVDNRRRASQLAGILRDLRSEEHTSELQSRFDLVCRLLLEKKKGLGRKMRQPKHMAFR